jgi:hypothetical protein
MQATHREPEEIHHRFVLAIVCLLGHNTSVPRHSSPSMPSAIIRLAPEPDETPQCLTRPWRRWCVWLLPCMGFSEFWNERPSIMARLRREPHDRRQSAGGEPDLSFKEEDSNGLKKNS